MIPRVMKVFVVLLVLTVAALAANAPSATSTMLVQSDWLAAHLNDKNTVVLHVGGDQSSYNAGHIPGARFLALSDIAITNNGIPNELPPVDALRATFERLGIGDRSRVVLYGDRMGVYAARAYFTLDYLGRGGNAAMLDGGLEKWRAEGKPVTTAAPAAASVGKLTVAPSAGKLIDMAGVRQLVASKKAVLIDARPPADYQGSPAMPRSGHIPGAVNVFWFDNLASQQNPAFKPVSDIRARYQSAGVKSGTKVIVYCHSGVQAAHDYFTLKLAGFTPVLYDGSMAEWVNSPGNAVAVGAN